MTRLNQAARLGVLLVACLCYSPAFSQTPGNPITDVKPVMNPDPMDAGPRPERFQVTLTAPKNEFFIGEAIPLTLRLTNSGDAPFMYSTGGDYRSTGRPERFHVTAVDAEGKAVEDPVFKPSFGFGGGLGGRYELAPSASADFPIPLLRYCRFDKPGTYKIQVSHDFGWVAGPNKTRPVAEITLTLTTPSPEQAGKNVEEVAKNPVDRGNEKAPDYSLLRDPIYLPFLNGRAKKGEVAAVEGISNIATPEATRVLIELSASANPNVAVAACHAINARLPAVDRDIPAEGNIPDPVRAYRITNGWLPKFKTIILTRASVLVTAKNPDLVREGAEMIERLGDWEDLYQIVRSLDREMQRFVDEYPEPFVPRYALFRAARQLYKRGAVPPKELRTKFAGECATYLIWVQEKGWGSISVDARAKVAPMLNHPLAAVRILAMETLPKRFPSATLTGAARTDAESRDATLKMARSILPEQLKSPAVGVRIAACGAAAKLQDWNLRPQIQQILLISKNEWERTAATSALLELNGRYLALATWAERIGQQGVALYEPLTALSSVLAHGGSAFDGEKAKGVNWQELKGKWKKFLTENRKEIEAGKVWAWDDAAFPRDLIPPCFTLDPPTPSVGDSPAS